MASWLQRQRKSDLVDLADAAGMKGAAIDMRKDDLIIALEQHLHANASRLSGVPALKDYWNRIASPVKKEAEAIASNFKDSPSKSVKRSRRATSEIDAETSPEPIQSILKKTPRTVQKAARSLEESFKNLPELPLPASPSDVANLVERRTSIIADEVSTFWSQSGITEQLESAREGLSTALSVQMLFSVLEAYYLQRVTLPWRFAFNIPAITFITSDKYPVSFPDFFVLLTADYWAPTMLWVFTNLLVPSTAAWFFNFTINKANRHGKGHGYEIDPFVFNIVKMLVFWLVYNPVGLRFAGLFSESTVATVQHAMPGGSFGVMTGSAVGAAAALYEAVLRR